MVTALAQALEARIRANRLLTAPVTWADELIFPDYAGLALTNIPHTILALLGCPLPKPVPVQAEIGAEAGGGVQRVVQFLMDGMGYLHLQMLMEQDAELRDAVLELTQGRGIVPLTSVAPSTTAVALPSLWTGEAPASTGMVGTLLFLSELGILTSMLGLKPALGNSRQDVVLEWGLKIDDIIATPSIGQWLEQHHIPTHLVLEKSLAGSGLSRILHRGVSHTHLHTGHSDMLYCLTQTLRETMGKKAYIAVYWGAVDAIAHAFGAHSDYTHQEIRTQLLGLRDLCRRADVRDGQTRLFITADHGHYDAPHTFNLDHDPVLYDATVMGASGDGRLPLLYIRADQKARVKTHLETYYADMLTYLDVEACLEAGMYGAGRFSPKARQRLGDLVLIPRLGWVVSDARSGVLKLNSWHGGLTDWEMLIPLFWADF